jgi:hypothetical protein
MHYPSGNQENQAFPAYLEVLPKGRKTAKRLKSQGKSAQGPYVENFFCI